MTYLTFDEFANKQYLNEEALEFDKEAGGYWITTKTGKRLLVDRDGKAKTTLGGTIKKGTTFDKIKGL